MNKIDKISGSKQIDFSDLDHLKQLDQTYQLISEGKFLEAFELLEKIVNQIQEENLYALMKQLQFWIKRVGQTIHLGRAEVGRSQQLFNYFNDFEIYVKKYGIYNQKDFNHFKKLIFNHMIDNLIYLFNHRDQDHFEEIFQLVGWLIELEEYAKAEETLIYLRKLVRAEDARIDFVLVKVFYLQQQKQKALLHLKDSFFWHDRYSYLDVSIEWFFPLINKMLVQNFTSSELSLWLPVYAKLENLLEVHHTLSKITFKKMIERVGVFKTLYHQRRNDMNYYEPRLLYGYLYVIDQLKLRIQKGRTEFEEDIKTILYQMANINDEIYQKVKKSYE